MGIVLKFDQPTWLAMKMVKADNAWMEARTNKDNHVDYTLAIKKNLSSLKLFIQEAYEEAA